MSKQLFNSFDTIRKELPDLSDTVSNLNTYYGHTPAKTSDAAEPEPLKDHIDLVNETASHLIKLHGLEKIIEGLIEDICEQLKMCISREGNVIKELFFAAIGFHDFGKLNENFQVMKMSNNEQFSKVNLLIGSRHSILSAYLFLNYYLEKLAILKVESRTADAMAGLICAFADPILKHHSSFFDVGEMDSEECQELKRFLRLIGMSSPAKHLSQVINQKKTFENIFPNDRESGSYPLFTLLKLNFSLLTAADYLATLSYQYNIDLLSIEDMNWWGILSSQKKADLHRKFRDSELYNKLAFEAPEKLIKPNSSLKKRSPENLNYLRSKMLGEVILKLRENKGKQLFYLKAPTGAGKTNISLAAAIEILQHDKKLNKIFYVFPFTTLITQTYSAIKEILDIGDNEIVQLHSKAEWNIKKGEEQEDGFYGKKWANHINNLFVHYPYVMLSHIRFFDVLKGNQKGINYLLHRLANSVVIIDELQSYSPKFWDHVNYFITHYAKFFNIRFILMSATLPEIGRLAEDSNTEWTELISEPGKYFQNANFAKRVTFDFSLLEQGFDDENKLSALADFLAEKSEEYAEQNNNQAKVIIEFIIKRSATDFAELVQKHPVLSQYKFLMMTGTILEPRRVQVKNWLQCEKWLKENPKVLLISTQVVEAGVNIDMDLGFKDTSLIDSDEQLAGRVNRNAKKSNNTVYLFNLDSEGVVYQKDERLKLQRKELSINEHKEILDQKSFKQFYNKIIENHLNNRDQLIPYFPDYLEHLRDLRFTEADREFQLIEDNTESLFIPLSIPVTAFSKEEQNILRKSNINPNSKDKVSGGEIFNLYKQTILNQSDDFIDNRDGFRKMQSLLSKFIISVYPQTAKRIEALEIEEYNQKEAYRFGYLYCSGYKHYYDYKVGLKFLKEKNEKAVDFI
jgi:CRISPR-associated endonuclease/helicase Cas3